MMYELRFDKKAIKYLEKLQKNTRKRIYDKLIFAKQNPYHFFERLTSRKEYKMPVGIYRVVADIEDNKLLILVLYIGHRKNIYDTL